VDTLPTNGHPSAVGRAKDRESSPVKDQRSTTVPRNELHNDCCNCYPLILCYKPGYKASNADDQKLG